MRFLRVLSISLVLLFASSASAMKLAPQEGLPGSQSLQPLPVQIHADVSHNVERTASAQDQQTVQYSQEVQSAQNSEAPQNSATGGSAFSPAGMSASEILLLVSAGILLLAGIFQAIKSLNQ